MVVACAVEINAGMRSGLFVLTIVLRGDRTRVLNLIFNFRTTA